MKHDLRTISNDRVKQGYGRPSPAYVRSVAANVYARLIIHPWYVWPKVMSILTRPDLSKID